MRDNATEIKKVLDEHQYSINTIIVEVMGIFKLHSIIRKAGFAKQDGYGVAEILALMIMLPLLLLNSVHSLYHSLEADCLQSIDGEMKIAIFTAKTHKEKIRRLLPANAWAVTAVERLLRHTHALREVSGLPYLDS